MNRFNIVSFLPLWLAWAVSGAEPVAKFSLPVPMRDGINLATDVYGVASNRPSPVIFARTPYNKEGIAGLANEASARGYVLVAQDTRGRFGSAGENLPFDRDGPDGADALNWIRRQSWSNGRVATWGGSAGAIVQFQLAAAQRDKLAAQYLVVGAPNLYDVVYVGGAFRKSLIEDWLRATRFGSNALSRWVDHPTYDDYWKERDAARHYKEINAPAMHIGGYWDIFAQGTIDAFVGYQERGGKRARGQQKLVMGPWAHAVLQEKVGELRFPKGNRPPNDVHDAWRWFDHWLKDADNGVDQLPAVTYYVLGDTSTPNAPGNEWRTARAWPPAPAVTTKYFLQADRGLSPEPPGARGQLEYDYDPKNPAPTVGGNQLSIPAGPMDQRPVEQRPDVLVFTSPMLTEPVEVTGHVRAKLWISTDVPDSDFVVRLCDVYPDGRSYNLCEGILRARFRDGFSRERFLNPQKTYPLEVDLWSTSIIFNRGHRLRVHVTSSSAPGFDPNPNTGAPFRADAQTRIAHHVLHCGGGAASHILLPVVRSH